MLKLNSQLFIGDNPPKFTPLVNKEDIKPDGGLWTSTYDNETGSSWVQWCLNKTSEDKKEFKSWLIIPKQDSKIFYIDKHADLNKLMSDYGNSLLGLVHYIDFVQMSKDFDAIHLTKNGEIETRHSHPYHLYGWFCESTLWLNPSFDKIDYLGTKEYNSIKK